MRRHDDEPEAPPRPLGPEPRARRAAALSHVRAYGDPVPRERARPVEAFDEKLREEVETMTRLMDDALGAGVAATRLGILHRVLVHRPPGKSDSPVRVLVNPELVRVVARDAAGEEIRLEASGPGGERRPARDGPPRRRPHPRPHRQGGAARGDAGAARERAG